MNKLACLCLLLCLSLLLSVGCAVSPQEDGADTSATVAETDGGDASVTSPYDTLPKVSLNRQIKFMSMGNDTDSLTDLNPGEVRGEILSDLIHRRNMVVEDDYDVTLTWQVAGSYDDLNAKVRQQVAGQLDDFDVFMNNKYAMSLCTAANYLTDLNSVLSMDLTNPWWDPSCRTETSIMGHNYVITGHISPSAMLYSACLIFHKGLMEDLNQEAPYRLVDEGTWTLNELLRYTDNVTLDLNGDSRVTEKDDRYGMAIWIYGAPFTLFYGCGGMYATMDEDGIPYLSYDASKTVNIYEKIYQLLIGENACIVTGSPITYDDYQALFADGRALFYDGFLGSVSQDALTGMKEDYGVVPMPKYDVSQPDYLSFVDGAAPLFMMALTEKHPEDIGRVLEAMGAYNYEHITPKLYSVITKSRDIRDPDSARMVDYVLRSRVYDFAYWADLTVANLYYKQILVKSPNIASALQSDGSASQLEYMMRKWDKRFES